MPFEIRISYDKGISIPSCTIIVGTKLTSKCDFIEVAIKNGSVDLFYQVIDSAGKIYKSASYINIPYSEAFKLYNGKFFLLQKTVLDTFSLRTIVPSSANARLVYHDLKQALITLVSVATLDSIILHKYGRYGSPVPD